MRTVVWLTHQNVSHLLKDGVLKFTPENVVLEKLRELMMHNLIFLSSLHCKEIWHLQLQKVHHQVSSPAILMVTLCHRLEEDQEVLVVYTTEPGGMLCLDR